jgi:hypothetical protein
VRDEISDKHFLGGGEVCNDNDERRKKAPAVGFHPVQVSIAGTRVRNVV